MALHHADTLTDDIGPERKLKSRIRLRLIEPHERERFDALLTQEHYLHSPTAVGAVLRYVVTHENSEPWLALLVFCSPALHLKPRDRWLQWEPIEVPQRRHLVAQNSRLLLRV